MLMIVGPIALFIALVALFLGSTAMKKIDMQSKAFTLRFLAEQQAGFDDLNAKMAKLEKRVRKTEKKLNGLVENDDESPKLTAIKK